MCLSLRDRGVLHKEKYTQIVKFRSYPLAFRAP